MKQVTIIGGGLAGSEASFYLLKRGYDVHLYEKRPSCLDGAHTTGLLGELVCSNSLKGKNLDNACGLLKAEMKELGSIMMEAASVSEVPSGNALSVDRELFATYITDKLKSFPNFHLHEEEITALPSEVILATGPLTSESLLASLIDLIGQSSLSFFDATAPIVKKEGIDFSKAYYKSRFSQDDDAYINCPFTKDEYFTFLHELLNAKRAELHEFDTHYFEGCLPIEVIASRGEQTLRHGPLKPFGLSTDEHPKPYAVAQLRQDTLLGDCYNLVGFQTNLTYPEQKRVFSMIPGLENATFVRYGLMHRNAYINSPLCLNEDLSLKTKPNLFVAGQLIGVEGYVESAAMGIVAAINYDRKAKGLSPLQIPKNTIMGSLLYYVTHADSRHFQPMNANWALVPNTHKVERLTFANYSLTSVKSFKEELDD